MKRLCVICLCLFLSIGCFAQDADSLDQLKKRIYAHYYQSEFSEVVECGREALEVLVYGANTEIAPSGRRHTRVTKTSQKRAQKIRRRAHFFAELLSYGKGVYPARVDFYGVFIYIFYIGAKRLQNRYSHSGVGYSGNVFYTANAVGK